MSNSFKDLVIRDATMEDCSAINQLHSAVSYEGVLTWGSVKTESQTREWLGLLLRLAYPCLVALSASGEIVACGALTPGWDPRKDAGSIHSVKLHIVVAQVHRNYGLATRLFGLLQQHHKSGARQIYRVVCLTLSINSEARSWLSTSGFSHCGSLIGVAQKNGIICDQEYFTRFISPSPPLQGRGFPDLALEGQHGPAPLSMPVDLDKKQIRNARMEDLPAMLAILNDAILRTNAISYSAPLEPWERKDWLARLITKGLPCLVAEVQKTVIGYVALDEYSPEFCFSRTWEISMYVRLDLTRHRIGRDLWLAALEHSGLKSRRIKAIVAENALGAGSVLKLGFACRISTSHSFFKFGEWQGHSLYQYDIPEQEEFVEE